MADALRTDPMFAHDEKGNPITRERICGCDKRFTQRLLSVRFMTIVDKREAMKAFMAQIPDYYVPVNCPRCERIELGSAARAGEFRRHEAAD